MTELITDEDIKWYENQVSWQTNPEYQKITRMELKLAKAIKELQEQQTSEAVLKRISDKYET